MELTVILKHRSSFITLENNDYKLTSDITSVEYEQLTIDKLDDPLATEDMLDDFATNPKYANTKVYLVSIYTCILILMCCKYLVCTINYTVNDNR